MTRQIAKFKQCTHCGSKRLRPIQPGSNLCIDMPRDVIGRLYQGMVVQYCDYCKRVFWVEGREKKEIYCGAAHTEY